MVFKKALLVGCVVGLFSCNSQNADKKAADAPAVPRPATTSQLGATPTGLLMSVVTDYYSLKDALVATSAPKAKAAAATLAVKADSLLKVISADPAMNPFYKTNLDSITQQCKIIAGIDDATCEKQRLSFGIVSNSVLAILKQAGVKNAGIYKQYCPMAFNEKGAIWLSNETEIKNPYFGKKMMECGEVQDSL